MADYVSNRKRDFVWTLHSRCTFCAQNIYTDRIFLILKSPVNTWITYLYGLPRTLYYYIDLNESFLFLITFYISDTCHWYNHVFAPYSSHPSITHNFDFFWCEFFNSNFVAVWHVGLINQINGIYSNRIMTNSKLIMFYIYKLTENSMFLKVNKNSFDESMAK